RYALRQDAAVPALSGANGHGANGHALNGNGSNGSNGTGTDPHGIPPVHDIAAGATPDRAMPSAVSDEPSWWARPTLASNWAAESIQAGHALGSPTELVSDASVSPAPAIDENDGLPVRVRQASLAPQLREATSAAGGTPGSAPGSAEEVRSTMSAMQRGWELGRSVAAASPDEAGSDEP